MYSTITETVTFPRRFVLKPNVSSPLTCRHPKHVRCSCHGQTTASTNATAQATNNTVPKSAPDPKRKDLEAQFYDVLLQIGHVLLRFPEACAAVNDLLQRLRYSPSDFTPAQPAEAS